MIPPHWLGNARSEAAEVERSWPSNVVGQRSEFLPSLTPGSLLAEFDGSRVVRVFFSFSQFILPGENICGTSSLALGTLDYLVWALSVLLIIFSYWWSLFCSVVCLVVCFESLAQPPLWSLLPRRCMHSCGLGSQTNRVGIPGSCIQQVSFWLGQP